MPTRVVDYLVHAVAALGVRHVFGVDGANIEDLYDAIFDAPDDVTGVIAKHEFSAATMADGYARTTGGCGVVASTSGGGAMNLVAGLAESFASRVPVLALVGQPPTASEGNGAFQDTSGRAGAIDAVDLFGAVSTYCARVRTARDLPDQLTRAVAAARRGGPAVLLLPKDVQQAELADAAPFRPPPRTHRLDRSGIARVRAVLDTAREAGKVVIIAGDQVARDDARDALARTAASLDAVVGVAPDAKDVYDNADPRFCGVAGTMGHPDLGTAIRSATLCLLVGTRLPVPARAGLETALAERTVVSIGAAPPYLQAIHATSTDLSRTLADLTNGVPGGEAESERLDAPAPLTPLPVPRNRGQGLRYRDLVETIGASLPEGTAVFADAGNTGAAVVHHLRVPRDGRFVVALGMGGMGYAFGAGIGASFARNARANDARRTVVIGGDGAFYMHGMEVHTAIEYRLPVTFVVPNNNAHAMCVTREQLYYRNRYSFNRFRPTHLGAGMAAMFPDLPTFSVQTVEELAAALRQCWETDGPAFVSIECDPDEIPPFLPFLTAVEQSSGP
ncbi:thiamine pyrophosphate-binding protein [Nocardia sp. CNY236]|uniref:thiamine pyrophosphate-binding protein n=1 Tax=Nocardia sp. CNY236 TaxID=1169152 RepID=UPI000407570A|nr:thiamine pyrophosphate-binding protein [Nocardia sp. CNY236]